MLEKKKTLSSPGDKERNGRLILRSGMFGSVGVFVLVCFLLYWQETGRTPEEINQIRKEMGLPPFADTERVYKIIAEEDTAAFDADTIRENITDIIEPLSPQEIPD